MVNVFKKMAYLRTRHTITREVTINPKIMRNSLKFYLTEKDVKNESGGEANLNIWMNKRGNLEVASQTETLRNSNGLVYRGSRICKHGGSFALVIPFVIKETLKAVNKDNLIGFKISAKSQHIEMEPVFS